MAYCQRKIKGRYFVSSATSGDQQFKDRLARTFSVVEKVSYANYRISRRSKLKVSILILLISLANTMLEHWISRFISWSRKKVQKVKNREVSMKIFPFPPCDTHLETILDSFISNETAVERGRVLAPSDHDLTGQTDLNDLGENLQLT